MITNANQALVVSTSTFAGCPQPTFSCQTDTSSRIIPQCTVVGAGGEVSSVDPMQCCNYTLDAFIQLAINIAMFILGISGSIALLMVVWGGFQYLTSAGNKTQVSAGTQTMVNAVIGLLIIFSSWMIVNFIMASVIAKPEPGSTGLTAQLDKIFRGSNKWSYQASICSPIHFGELGKVDEILDVPPPATVSVNPTIGKADPNAPDVRGTPPSKDGITGKECFTLCKVTETSKSGAVISNNSSFLKSFVYTEGTISKTVTQSGVNTLQSISAVGKCTCDSLSALRDKKSCGNILTTGGGGTSGQTAIGIQCPQNSSFTKQCIFSPQGGGNCQEFGYCMVANKYADDTSFGEQLYTPEYIYQHIIGDKVQLVKVRQFSSDQQNLYITRLVEPQCNVIANAYSTNKLGQLEADSAAAQDCQNKLQIGAGSIPGGAAALGAIFVNPWLWVPGALASGVVVTNAVVPYTCKWSQSTLPASGNVTGVWFCPTQFTDKVIPDSVVLNTLTNEFKTENCKRLYTP